MDQQKTDRYLLNFARFVVFGMMIIGFALAMTACQTAQGIVTAAAGNQTSYKYDMSGTINGTKFNGVGVIPASPKYEMSIESQVDVDLLTVTSCHREFSVESAISVGWFKQKRGYTYEYNPSQGLEDVGSCLVRIGSYNKADAQNAWAIVDFETPDATLPAESLCNGSDDKTNGVSICQSREGLIQVIKFDTPVRVSDKIPDGCKPSSDDLMTWTYRAYAGECVVAFQEISGLHRVHRHTTIGYNQIQVRGN